jgi:group I intron endonuclease
MSKQLRGQSGIYCWINLLNGKYYIGSAVDLGNRVNDYFQDSYYKSRTNTIIVRAILKYGIGNFALVILDFVDKEDLLSSLFTIVNNCTQAVIKNFIKKRALIKTRLAY